MLCNLCIHVLGGLFKKKRYENLCVLSGALIVIATQYTSIWCSVWWWHRLSWWPVSSKHSLQWVASLVVMAIQTFGAMLCTLLSHKSGSMEVICMVTELLVPKPDRMQHQNWPSSVLNKQAFTISCPTCPGSLSVFLSVSLSYVFFLFFVFLHSFSLSLSLSFVSLPSFSPSLSLPPLSLSFCPLSLTIEPGILVWWQFSFCCTLLPFLFVAGPVLHHCGCAALFLPCIVCMDVSRGSAAVRHADWGLWVRALTSPLVLPLWLWRSYCYCGHLGWSVSWWLWNRFPVSVIMLMCVTRVTWGMGDGGVIEMIFFVCLVEGVQL